MKSHYQTACTNCKEPMSKQHVFQGVVICENCFKIVSHVVQRTKKQLSMLFLTYTDMLRVALVKGEMRPPQMPDGARKGMPLDEFTKALQNIGEVHGQDHRPASRRESEVRPLRDGAQDQDRQTRDRPGDAAVRRRR